MVNNASRLWNSFTKVYDPRNIKTFETLKKSNIICRFILRMKQRLISAKPITRTSTILMANQRLFKFFLVRVSNLVKGPTIIGLFSRKMTYLTSNWSNSDTAAFLQLLQILWHGGSDKRNPKPQVAPRIGYIFLKAYTGNLPNIDLILKKFEPSAQNFPWYPLNLPHQQVTASSHSTSYVCLSFIPKNIPE